MLANARLDVDVFDPSAVGGMPEVVEDQDTFSGNALKKARCLAELLPDDGWALADDSGLSVDFLDGAPGVYSARYAGEGASDSENLEKLLKKLHSVPSDQRGGGFQCHLALVSPQGEEFVFRGECRGIISKARTGEGGFGYDPIFVPKGFYRSFAELSREEKAKLSHRGEAMRALIDWISRRLSEA